MAEGPNRGASPGVGTMAARPIVDAGRASGLESGLASQFHFLHRPLFIEGDVHFDRN